MIKSFAFFESNNYIFNNQVVQIVDTNKSSGQIDVTYLDEFGKEQHYIADTIAEMEEDFIPTSDLYVKKPLEDKKEKKEKKKSEKDEYNIVYYIGKKKIETVNKAALPQKLAYALKNGKYKHDPKYQMGRLEVEAINETEGMIKGYTDPNKGNLGYNWSAVPKRDVKKNEGPNMIKISEIGIGSSDPVKKFKDWNGHYWERKKPKKTSKKKS